MPRRAEEELKRIHVQLFYSDHEILESIFADNIGVSPAIRKIVRIWLDKNNVMLGQVDRGIAEIV